MFCRLEQFTRWMWPESGPLPGVSAATAPETFKQSVIVAGVELPRARIDLESDGYRPFLLLEVENTIFFRDGALGQLSGGHRGVLDAFKEELKAVSSATNGEPAEFRITPHGGGLVRKTEAGGVVLFSKSGNFNECDKP